MIALITATIVMLAAALLIGVTRSMVNSYSTRLADAQVALSEASAADGLAMLIEREGIGGLTESVSFSLAGVETEFSLIEQGTAGFRTGFYRIENPAEAVVIPTGRSMASASATGPERVSVVFYSSRTFQPVAEYTLETSMAPVAGTGIFGAHGNGVVLVHKGGGETAVYAVTDQGITGSTFSGNIFIPANAHLSAAYSPSGQPLLIVSNGSNCGVLFNAETAEAMNVTSPPGTSPVFMPDGSLFGTTGEGGYSPGFIRVREAFSGDFNNDGIPDMAFASSHSLTVVSGATGEIHTARPGGVLVCWGGVQGRSGLAAMWAAPGGGENWLRLGHFGFNGFTPDMIYRMGWQGRFTGTGNTMAGILNGSAVVASSSGNTQELLEGDVFIGNADGDQLDFFLMGQDGLEAVFNPVNGDGNRLVFQTRNTYMGETIPGNTYIFSIYGSGTVRRVFHSLEGVSR